LQPVSANRCADLHGGFLVLSAAGLCLLAGQQSNEYWLNS
jgi:hypothetical protein